MILIDPFAAPPPSLPALRTAVEVRGATLALRSETIVVLRFLEVIRGHVEKIRIIAGNWRDLTFVIMPISEGCCHKDSGGRSATSPQRPVPSRLR